MGFRTMEKEIGISSVVGVKAYGEFPAQNQMSITSIEYGVAQNDFYIEVLDTVSAGAETVVWGEDGVTINVEAGVSTITQVLAAAGGITGTPWGTLAAIAAGATAVAALVRRSIRDLPDAVLGVMEVGDAFDLKSALGVDVVPQLIAGALKVSGAPTIAFEQSDSNFAGVKAKADASNINVEALFPGAAPDEYTVVIADAVSAGAEAVVWATGGVTINIEAGVSTVAQVIAAAGGVTGTPWGTITKKSTAALTDTVAAVSSTAIKSLDNPVSGKVAAKIAGSNVVVTRRSVPQKQILSAGSRFLRVLGSSSGGGKIRLTVGY